MRRVLFAIALPAVVALACETVDLGQPPSDINACRPSQQYFIDEIWPNFLAKDGYPNGVHCYDANCHGALAPNALDMIVPTTAGTVPLTGDWASNYMTVTEEMSCSNVASSKLLELPAGLRVHGGGKLIEPDGPEATLIKAWISRAVTRRLTVAAVVLAAALASPARAEDQALVRVIAEAASVRTGPGFGYRSVYRANQGEVLTVIGRATHDHWFRVELPDGTYGWVLGDEVFPLDVDTAAAHRGPSIFRRMGNAIFSPSPLMIENVTFAFSAGVLGGDGMFLFRPAVLLAPHVALEATIGETVGNQADVIYAAGGFNAYLFPTSPLTPFVGGAAGGAFGRKKADQYAIQTGNYSMVNVGGGLVASFKKRISVRGDVRHYVIFNANHTQRIQEFSGALAVYF